MPYYASSLGDLLGREIETIRVTKGEEIIRFGFGGYPEDIAFHAVGDCCSESWIADILNPETILNETILSVREDEMPKEDPTPSRTRQDSDQLFGYTLESAKGSCQIIFRNSSNGYYGGWLETYTVV